jgi:branched-chain amino acid transport system ATP-binding protein
VALVTRPGTSLARVLKAGADIVTDAPVLEFEDVELRFVGVTAIDGISFDVHAHELFSIIGPNGAGKTSIFNCLSGLYRPQGGSIRFLGENILGRSPHAIARMGMARTFQNVELFHNLTVVENLMLGRHHHVTYGPLAAMLYLGRARRQEISYREVVEEIIDFLEIESYRQHPVGLLPYGMKKRVELGRALAMEPNLLLLDEPVSGMNVEETEDMARFILDIREELEIPMILVEHDMGVVMDIADRILVVDFGRAIACDIPEKIQQNPDVIGAYLGKEHAEAKTGAAAGG